MDYSIENSGFKVYGNSVPYFQKERNGDHLMVLDLQKENVLIAIVADGISKQPCDWLASSLTCSKFITFFLGSDILSIEERIRVSIGLTNETLRKIDDSCRGLSSTLSLLIWEYDEELFHFVNIGDSRIYTVSNGKMVCLTKDDSLKSTKTIYTPIGKRTVDDSQLTNYIGKPNIEILVQSARFVSGDLLLLASDGFYDARKSSFENRIVEMAGSEDLESSFQNLIELFKFSAKDDSTAIIIKKLKPKQAD